MRNTAVFPKIFFCLLLISLLACSSQEKIVVEKPLETWKTNEKVWDFSEVDSKAEIVGGPMALARATNYPESSKRMRETGTVKVEFIVWSDGSISDFEVLESVSKTLDKEAILAVQKVEFRPAVHDGKNVSSKMSANVGFRLR